MSRIYYVSNPVQDKIVLELVALIKYKLQLTVGGWICLHGETLSGLTTVLHRLCNSQRFVLKSPWFISMTPLPHLVGVKAALLHGMRLPYDSGAWPNTSVVPRFLSDYLMCSQIKLVLVDDFHIVKKLSKAEQRRFKNIILELTQPPYSLIFVLSGNFASFQFKSVDWHEFTAEPLFMMNRFVSVKEVQSFSNAILKRRSLKVVNSHDSFLLTFDDARDILDLTKGYVGEIVFFLSKLAQEYLNHGHHVTGIDAFSRANCRYRVRND